ncbi:MAG: hypothetical protein EP330_28745 [Deltaproteobacteria bacterium]|nr:MAG: hypothetical protein EP330_28745 [Deltaproteobacteria bacterium]
MRLSSTLLAMALAFGTATLAPIQTAEATTIAPLTIEQLTDASTLIVEGKVSRVWTEVDDHQKVWTRALVDVDTLHKGPADTPEQIVIDTLGGHHWDRVTAVEGQARFSEGEQVLVFLDVVSHGTRLTPAAMFHGKFTIRRAAGDTDKHAMRWIDRPNAAFDAQFLPYPAPEDRIYVDDLRAQISARVTAGWDGEPIPGISEARLRQINEPQNRTTRVVREETR